MKSLNFKNSVSQKIYDSYMRRIERSVSILSKQDREEILLEFNSHIFEAIELNDSDSEEDMLLDILDRLGEPEEVLKPLVADRKLYQATSSFNPIHIFRALSLNVGNGISYLLFSICYLSLLGFVYAIIMKIINPKEVGLYVKNGTMETLGTYKGISPDDGVVEVLGNWFIPVMMMCIIVLFVCITRLLRLKHKFDK